MPRPVISEATEISDLDACFSVRFDVFCIEQKVNQDAEFDGLDDYCRHYLATLDSVEIGTARVRPLDKRVVKIERVAVTRTHRNSGIGRRLVSRALDDARKRGYSTAFLNSQVHACPFYEKLGFLTETRIFSEEGIPHRGMRKTL